MAALTFRATILALGVALAPFSAQAHGFPDSTLVLTELPSRLDLTITLPLAELILAEPSLAGLGDLPSTGPLPPEAQKDLAEYLDAHVSLTPEGRPSLDLAVNSARLQVGTDDHIGQYDQLEVGLTAAVPVDWKVVPLTLGYDAILHEVRNHNASVWLAVPGKEPEFLGEIRFDTALGRARPLLLIGTP